MKKRLASKIFFLLAALFCTAFLLYAQTTQEQNYYGSLNREKVSPEEKVLYFWNELLNEILNTGIKVTPPLYKETNINPNNSDNAEPQKLIFCLSNFKDALFEYTKSEYYIIELDGSPSKTAECIDKTLFFVSSALESIHNDDEAELSFSLNKLYLCMNDFMHFTIEESRENFFPFLELLIIISFLSIIFVVAGTFYLKNKNKIEELTKQNIHEKLITKTIIDVQESERTRISRELHDTVTQDSRTALLYINKLEQLYTEEKEAKNSGKNFCKEKCITESEELISKIKTLETQNLLNIRNIIRNMTPPEIENADFVNLLNEFAVNVTKFSDIPCKFYTEKSELFQKLSGTQKLHIFRIIQEAVTNAQKHSGAEEISIFARTESFSGDDEKGKKPTLVFIVSDDGKGMDEFSLLQNTQEKFESRTENSKISITEQSTHLGLKGILSRAEILGGTVEIKSSAEIGTTIILKVEC